MVYKAIFGLDRRGMLLRRSCFGECASLCVTFADEAPSLAVAACFSLAHRFIDVKYDKSDLRSNVSPKKQGIRRVFQEQNGIDLAFSQ